MTYHDPDDLAARVLAAIRAGKSDLASITCHVRGRLPHVGDRDIDRSLQRSRRKGLVIFDRVTGKRAWRLVEAP